MAIANKNEAAAFLAALKVDADGLPAANATEAVIADVMQAHALVGKAFDFPAYLAKVKAASKAQGKELGRKTECPLSKAQLAAFAASGAVLRLTASIDGQTIGVIDCEAREFSTGSVGFGGNGKLRVTIDGTPVVLQCTPNFSIVNSKLVQ